VCGVGKSGRIGRKVEATMTSMGVYSVFLHPTEALHGDLGMIRLIDTVLLISFSGRTPELMLLLPHLPSVVPIIAITAHMDPTTCPLFAYHDPQMTILLPAPIHIDEETSFGVSAPTTSTTVAVALGDALAIATARRLHTSPGQGPAEVFKGFHPGGAIGAALSVSTPRSVPTPASASPLSSLPSVDYVNVKRIDHRVASSSPPVADDQQFCRSISDLAIPLHKIPTVTSSRIHILDILITAIQHPTSKSWVKLSPTEIIPPRRVRSLSQESNVNSAIADLTGPVCIGPDDWLCVPASATVGHVHHWLTDVTKGDAPLPLVCVMDDNDTGIDQSLGFVEVEDVCGIIV
jgi:D-arabinose 5-phosphate isomerase GutQ